MTTQLFFRNPADAVAAETITTPHGNVVLVKDLETRWYTSEEAVDRADEYLDETDEETLGYAAWCRAFDAQAWPLRPFTGEGYGIPTVNCTPEFVAACEWADAHSE